MKVYFLASILLASINVFASHCLDISGSYDMNYSGNPKCAHGLKVTKSWYKYEQVECKTLTYSKVYKLADNTFCESSKINYITDGNEHLYGNPDIMSKIELFMDKHVSTNRSISSGKTSTSTKTLDSNGNLVIDDSSGFHEVYEKSIVQ